MAYKKMPRGMKMRGGKTLTQMAGTPIGRVKRGIKTGAAKLGKAAVELAKMAPEITRVAGVSPMMGLKMNAAAFTIVKVAELGDGWLTGKKGNVPVEIGSKPLPSKPTPRKPMRDAKLTTSDEGVGVSMGIYEGVQASHDGIKIHKFTEKFMDGGKDAKLVLAKKLYGTTTVNYYSTLKTVYNRLYAYAGLNSKGIVYPYQAMATSPAYSDIDTVVNTVLNASASMFGESLADTALMLNKALIGNVGAPTVLTEMPPLATGDIDYYFPIQSWKAVYNITNTNAFMPVKVKIYVLQCRRDTGLGPVDTWFQRGAPGATQDPVRMNGTYVNYQVAEGVVGLAPDPFTEVSIHPQASPGMSQKFAETYKICSVRTFELKASDQLEFTLERHFNRSTSAAEYAAQKSLGFNRINGQLDIMIEFQGMPTPYYKSGLTANTVSYSAESATGFAKIRYTVDKYFTHSFPISQGLGLYNPQSAQYTPSFIGTAQRPLVLFSDTAPYSSYTADPAEVSKYLIPLVTNNTTQYGRPLIKDPV